MNSRILTVSSLLAGGSLALVAPASVAEAPAQAGEAANPYAPLALESRPAATRWQTDYTGALRLGLGYTSNDNYMFGEYNGLHEEEATLIGDLSWQDFHSGDDYWQLSLSDLGLDTREGRATWGRPDRMKVTLGFDSQLQVRNDSGATPFRGNVTQSLPGDWVTGQNTAGFTALDGALLDFDRELKRDKLFMSVDTRINDYWQLESNLSYEEKEGHGDIGAGIYINESSADSVLLRAPVDYSTTEFDFGLAYSDERLHLNGVLAYSGFDNDDELLTWQNPYSDYGPDVSYPAGTGGLALAPDNEQVSGRLTGHYIFAPRARLQFDGGYAVASQDQDYEPYTVNPALLVTQPLPRTDFDGEVATNTGHVRLLTSPFATLPKLNADVFYKVRDRSYDINRDGYLYVRGDGSDQPGSAATVYNTDHDYTSQTAGFEAGYRLPLRSKLTAGYAFEKVDRRNAATENTEEDRYTLEYRIQPWTNFSARTHVEYADRAADTYEWSQNYYALLDTELINATPDTERYINHPELMQYYLANRERWEAGTDFSYLPDPRWNLNLNLLWRDDDYDQSDLGLTTAAWYRAHFSASVALSETLSGSMYTGVDSYEGDQTSRTFRGGQEKNAFAVYPPLPQASDPQQDWDLDTTDTSYTLGANLRWQVAPDLELTLDYSYVDTQAEQDFTTNPGGTVAASDLPDVDTRLHHVEASGIWRLRDELSLQLDYQFYSYKTDDWAWDNVRADTIGKVLTFGQTNPNEDIHYVGVSAIYRWQ